MSDIGFDIDGVLAHAGPWILKEVQFRGFLKGKTMADVTDYDWYRAFPGQLPEGLITELLGSPGFAREMLPCPWLGETARQCAAAGHRVHVVTARYPTVPMLGGTKLWLERWQVPHVAVHHCRPSEKVLYAREHGLAAFVEDKRETAIAMQAVCRSFLVAMPYNVLPPGPEASGVCRWEREQFLRLPEFLQ
jgi:uncharacterized HAD superfamily protein